MSNTLLIPFFLLGISCPALAKPTTGETGAGQNIESPTPAAATSAVVPGTEEPKPAVAPLGAPTSVDGAKANVAVKTPADVATAQDSPNPVGRAPSKTKAKPVNGEKGWEGMKCKAPGENDTSDDVMSDCSGVFGLRLSMTHSNIQSGYHVGLMLSAQGEKYTTRGFWSSRNIYGLAIGGGNAGFEGTLLGSFAGGVRLPVGEHHGPVARLGIVGYITGNNETYASLLELPQLQLGYQYLSGKYTFELGGTAGAVLVGRSRTSQSSTRDLAGFEAGGYLAVQTPWGRLGVSGTRLPTNDGWNSDPVNVFQGTLCAHAAFLALCADTRVTTTKAYISESEARADIRSFYSGFTIGGTSE